MPPTKRVQPTGWIGPILATKCGKNVVPIYQSCTPSRRLTRRALGGSCEIGVGLLLS